MTGIRKIKEMKIQRKIQIIPIYADVTLKKTKTKILNKKSDIWKT